VSRTWGIDVNGKAWLAMRFPLRPDFVAEIIIPRDLTSAEADRLAAFIKAIPPPTPSVSEIPARTEDSQKEEAE
jgi:hypothetical protein